MKRNILTGLYVAISAACLLSCSDDSADLKPNTTDNRMAITFNFNHPAESRATETAFEAGDIAGLYMWESSVALDVSGNVINNEPLTSDGTGWKFRRQFFWDRGTYNACGYYPHIENASSISDLPFEVQTRQDRQESGLSLSGYEASDFLYASRKGIVASAQPVEMTFRHIMSKISIRIIKGEEFEGDIPDDAVVYIHNTVTESTVDLNAGIATKAPRGKTRTITARPVGNHTYSAIVVPQRLENRVPLIEVEMKGVSYLFDSKFLFKQGTHHLVNLIIDKNPEQIKIEIGGEIQTWN